jgi:UDP-glucoronosyl and UDP-glucosyl transferase
MCHALEPPETVHVCKQLLVSNESNFEQLHVLTRMPCWTKALWYGVPLVVAPSHADQPDNANKVVTQGAGLSLVSVYKLKEEDVHSALMRVMLEPSFREQSLRIGRRMRSRKRTGLERAAGGLPPFFWFNPMLGFWFV